MISDIRDHLARSGGKSGFQILPRFKSAAAEHFKRRYGAFKLPFYGCKPVRRGRGLSGLLFFLLLGFGKLLLVNVELPRELI